MSGMTPAEAAAHARRIIDTFMYLTIATADDDGRPWASPVWFAPASPTEFLWASDPHARHSRNIATPFPGLLGVLCGTASRLEQVAIGRRAWVDGLVSARPVG